MVASVAACVGEARLKRSWRAGHAGCKALFAIASGRGVHNLIA